MGILSKLKDLVVPPRPAEKFENMKNAVILQNMTLVEYLEACHVVFAEGLAPRPDLTTIDAHPSEHGPHCNGGPTEVRDWPAFDEQQAAVLAKVHAAIPADLRAFESLAFLRGLASRHWETPTQSDEATKLKALDAIHVPVAFINGLIRGQGLQAIKSTGDFAYTYQPARCLFVVSPETGYHQVSYIGERNTLYDWSGDEAKPVLATKYMSPDKVADTGIPEVFRTMVELKAEYGQIITGESIVFLRIDWDEPTVVYRHTATPKTDIDGILGENLHRTAVSQQLAFILRVTGSV